MKKLIMFLVIALNLNSVYASNLITTYSTLTENGANQNCEYLLSKLEIDSDEVTGENLYLKLERGVRAQCDLHSDELIKLSFNREASEVLDINSSDFGKRVFQIIRKYGDPQFIDDYDNKKFLFYTTHSADFGFEFQAGKVFNIQVKLKNIFWKRKVLNLSHRLAKIWSTRDFFKNYSDVKYELLKNGCHINILYKAHRIDNLKYSLDIERLKQVNKSYDASIIELSGITDMFQFIVNGSVQDSKNERELRFGSRGVRDEAFELLDALYRSCSRVM